jgi:tetratricopeptide (TPR) repeat protein
MAEKAPRIAALVLYYGGGDMNTARTDLPVFIVRAGKDNPFGNRRIDDLVSKALAGNAPWTVVYAPLAHHAFDIFDANEETPKVIERTISFFDQHLKTSRGSMAAMSPERQAVAYGFFQEWPKALEAWQKLQPKYPDNELLLTQLGLAQANTGHPAEGIQNLERVVKMGGENPQVLHALGVSYVQARRYDEGLGALQKAIDGHFFNAQTYAIMGTAHIGKKSYSDAIGAFQKALDFGPATWPMYYNLACAYALSGRKDDAFTALGKSIDAGCKDRQGLMTDPDLAPIRDDPRFQDLLKRLG